MIKELLESERSKIVEAIFNQSKKDFREKLLYFGLKGSMGRGEYGPLSDIDIVIVVQRIEAGSWKLFRYNDTVIDISLYNYDEAIQEVTEIGGNWPEIAGSILESKPLFDKLLILDTLKKELSKIPKNNFYDALEFCLPYEYFSKIFRCYNNKDYANLRVYANNLFLLSCMNIGLLNQKYFTKSGVNILSEIKLLKDVPKDFVNNSKGCYSENFEEVFESCKYLFNIAKDLEERFSKFKNYNYKIINLDKFPKIE